MSAPSAQLFAHLLHIMFAQQRTTAAQLAATHTLYTTYIPGGAEGGPPPYLANEETGAGDRPAQLFASHSK